MGASEAKTLLQMKRHLQAAAQDGKKAQALDLLEQLDAFDMNAALLKETKIGITVNDLRKQNALGDRVTTLAKKLLLRWKTSYRQDAAGKTASAPSGGSTSSQPRPAGRVELRERSMKLDGVNPPPLNSQLRERCLEMLYNAICMDSDVDAAKLLDMSATLERLIHEEFLDAQGGEAKYKAKIRSLYSNLKDKENPELRYRISQGYLSVTALAKMSALDMASRERRRDMEKAKSEAMKDAQTAQSSQSETDMFKCGKCKQRKTKYYQMQTRSADEPMTTFVTCVNCGNRWKFC
ncbi:hypothetical protein CXG81DRAFT_9181 [Caulochytrium protostelioides]|uniref:Transcription elongation factor n=1 Tax=Caulochytrium protostelioides TaxID=1555241 RepID=A0A4P9XDS4_9FUNG|nr:hypothetical protein CXG81DRAFT_9181 [Caulochytrium protostelioides]|eukprot:RKP03674.1 hypothetical protein CXG81DRAFT_9181 [Caulochytrium protostelioides]